MGAGLLFAPATMLRYVSHVEVDRKSVAVARVLGTRQLGQAVMSGINPSASVLALGVWVDAAHGASALALAAVDRARARAGLTDAVVAGMWAALAYRDLTTSRMGPAGDDTREVLARWALEWLPAGAPLRRVADQATGGQSRTSC